MTILEYDALYTSPQKLLLTIKCNDDINTYTTVTSLYYASRFYKKLVDNTAAVVQEIELPFSSREVIGILICIDKKCPNNTYKS